MHLVRRRHLAVHPAVLFLAATILGCDASPSDLGVDPVVPLVVAEASVNSGSIEEQVIPIDLELPFTCGDGTEHTMWVYGEAVIRQRQSVDAQGRFHSGLHVLPRVIAVDGDGNTYLGGYSKLNLTSNGPAGFTQTQSIRLIGHGGAPNYSLHIVGRLTVNANGETTVDFQKSRVSCQ